MSTKNNWYSLKGQGWSLGQRCLLLVAYPWMAMVNSDRPRVLFVGIWIAYLGALAVFAPKKTAILGAVIPLGLLLLSLTCGAILVTWRARKGTSQP